VSQVSTRPHFSRPILAVANEAISFDSYFRAEADALVPGARHEFLIQPRHFRPIVLVRCQWKEWPSQFFKHPGIEMYYEFSRSI
jgi:hypothetical protein